MSIEPYKYYVGINRGMGGQIKYIKNLIVSKIHVDGKSIIRPLELKNILPNTHARLVLSHRCANDEDKDLR